MDEQLIVLIIVVQGVICGGLSAVIANSKGRDGNAWFLAGLFFGILGLIASAAVAKAESSRNSIYNQKKCPFCAEAIKIEAIVCRFCGRDLPRDERPKIDGAPVPPPAVDNTSERPLNNQCQSSGDSMTKYEARWKRGNLIVCHTCNVSKVFPRRVI